METNEIKKSPDVLLSKSVIESLGFIPRGCEDWKWEGLPNITIGQEGKDFFLCDGHGMFLNDSIKPIQTERQLRRWMDVLFGIELLTL